MCKKIISVAAACAVILSLASCNVNMKDYSSNPDTEVAGSLTVSDSSNTSDDEKVIGYDIYRPGQESSSADSDSSSASSSKDTDASSSKTSASSAAQSGNTSSKSTSSDKTSSKSTSSEKTSSDKTSAEVSSEDNTSSYYDDWEDDNVIYFSELLGG